MVIDEDEGKETIIKNSDQQHYKHSQHFQHSHHQDEHDQVVDDLLSKIRTKSLKKSTSYNFHRMKSNPESFGDNNNLIDKDNQPVATQRKGSIFSGTVLDSKKHHHSGKEKNDSKIFHQQHLKSPRDEHKKTPRGYRLSIDFSGRSPREFLSGQHSPRGERKGKDKDNSNLTRHNKASSVPIVTTTTNNDNVDNKSRTNNDNIDNKSRTRGGSNSITIEYGLKKKQV
jgi:hypothetical protein